MSSSVRKRMPLYRRKQIALALWDWKHNVAFDQQKTVSAKARRSTR